MRKSTLFLVLNAIISFSYSFDSEDVYFFFDLSTHLNGIYVNFGRVYTWEYDSGRKNHAFKVEWYCSCSHPDVHILLMQVDWPRIYAITSNVLTPLTPGETVQKHNFQSFEEPAKSPMSINFFFFHSKRHDNCQFLSATPVSIQLIFPHLLTTMILSEVFPVKLLFLSP